MKSSKITKLVEKAKTLEVSDYKYEIIDYENRSIFKGNQAVTMRLSHATTLDILLCNYGNWILQYCDGTEISTLEFSLPTDVITSVKETLNDKEMCFLVNSIEAILSSSSECLHMYTATKRVIKDVDIYFSDIVGNIKQVTKNILECEDSSKIKIECFRVISILNEFNLKYKDIDILMMDFMLSVSMFINLVSLSGNDLIKAKSNAYLLLEHCTEVSNKHLIS